MWLPPIKFLKIALPVATVTSATIATVSLVSSRKEDVNLDSSLEDKVLEDFEKPTEKFEEQIMLYAKDGKGEGSKVSSEEEKQQLLERLKKEGLQDDGNPKGNSNPDPSALAQQLQEKTDQLPSGEGDVAITNPLSLDLQKPEDNAGLISEPKGAPSINEENDDQGGAKNILDNSSESKSEGDPRSSDLDQKDEDGSVNHNEVQDVSLSPEAKSEDTHQLSDSEISDTSEDNTDDEQEKEDLTKKQDSSENKGTGDEAEEGKDTKDSPSKEKTPESEDGVREKNPQGHEPSDKKDLQPSLGNQDDRDHNTSRGVDDSQSSSGGRSDGIDGERGQEPISPEQLKRFEEIGQEASTVLDSLKGLLDNNFQI